MDVKELEIEKLIPYAKNPRKNDGAVDAVAASIREYGFKVPIVVDKNMVLVTGHTRLKAAIKLGLKTVPVVVAHDLNEEQARAFRLADNKVAELAKWDMGLLRDELEEIETINMGDFGFSFDDNPISLEPTYYGDERERSYGQYHMREFVKAKTEGWYQMPYLEPCNAVPSDLMGFNYVLSSDRTDVGIHFYIDDYQFERLWNRPHEYIEKLKKFQCVLTPDFSLYMDMPMAMKIWNVYRSRMLGAMMQQEGINVIPTVSWAEPETFDFCFDGIPKGSTVSVSTVGVKREQSAHDVFVSGMDAMIERVKPKTILLYGGDADCEIPKGIKVFSYTNSVTERMKNWAEEVQV